MTSLALEGAPRVCDLFKKHLIVPRDEGAGDPRQNEAKARGLQEGFVPQLLRPDTDTEIKWANGWNERTLDYRYRLTWLPKVL